MSMRRLLAPDAPGCDQVDDTAGTTSAHATESELGGDRHPRREIAVGRIALVERVRKPWPKAAIQCHLLPFGAAKSSGSLQSHPRARVGRRLPPYGHWVVWNRQARCRLVPRPKAAIQCHLLPFGAAKSSGSLPSHPRAEAGHRLPSYGHWVVRNRQARCRLVPRPKAAIQCHLLPFAAAKIVRFVAIASPGPESAIDCHPTDIGSCGIVRLVAVSCLVEKLPSGAICCHLRPQNRQVRCN